MFKKVVNMDLYKLIDMQYHVHLSFKMRLSLTYTNI